MSILKRLVLREWFRSLIVSVLVLFFLVTVTDLIAGFLRSSVTAYEVLQNFVLKIPFMLSKILPISCLIATLFGLNRLKTKNELIAIFAGGMSRRGIIFLIIQASLVVGLVQFFILSYADPYSKKLRKRWIPNSEKKFDKSKALTTSGLLKGGKIWYKSGDYFVTFANFDKQQRSLNKIALYFYNTKGVTKRILTAEKAIHKEGSIWTFINGRDYPGLEESAFSKILEFKQFELDLQVTDRDFWQINVDINTLNVTDLAFYINHLSHSGISTTEYELLLYDKFASTLMCTLFALISISIAFNPSRRSGSFGLNVIFIFVFTIIYWLLYTFALNLGESGKIPALVSSFAIPILCTLYLCFHLIRHRRL